MSRTQSALEELNASWRRLLLCWQESQEQWKDATTREFEDLYWGPLSEQTQTTMKEMERLAQVLDDIYRRVP